MNRNDLLKHLQEQNRLSKQRFPSHADFVEWASCTAPFLKYNPQLYAAFSDSQAILNNPNLSSVTVVPHFNNLKSLLAEAITELEHDLTFPSPAPEIVLTDEHGLWWFFQHCTTKIRGWLVTKTIMVFCFVVVTAYLAGQNNFISELIALCKRALKP
jgi:hypothetical protein